MAYQSLMRVEDDDDDGLLVQQALQLSERVNPSLVFIGPRQREKVWAKSRREGGLKIAQTQDGSFFRTLLHFQVTWAPSLIFFCSFLSLFSPFPSFSPLFHFLFPPFSTFSLSFSTLFYFFTFFITFNLNHSFSHPFLIIIHPVINLFK